MTHSDPIPGGPREGIMNVLSKKSTKLFGKATLFTVALGGFLLFAGAPSAKANAWEDCDRRVERAEWKLHEAIERHGYYSRQAQHWRHELREEQQRCWRERERREHRDYDWHRYDRDRDRD
jgi:hypothetical protein